MHCSSNCRSNLYGKRAKVKVQPLCPPSCECDGLNELPFPEKRPRFHKPTCRFWTWLPPFTFSAPQLISKLRHLLHLRELPLRIAKLRIFRKPSETSSYSSVHQNTARSSPSSCICGSETCLSKGNLSPLPISTTNSSCASDCGGASNYLGSNRVSLQNHIPSTAAVYHPVSIDQSMTQESYCIKCSNCSPKRGRSLKRVRSPKGERSPRRGRSPRRQKSCTRGRNRSRERSSSKCNKVRSPYDAESPHRGNRNISRIIVSPIPQSRTCPPTIFAFPKPIITPGVLKLRNTKKLHVSCNQPKSFSSRKPFSRPRPKTSPEKATSSLQSCYRCGHAKSCPSIPQVLKKTRPPSKSSKNNSKYSPSNSVPRAEDSFLCSECIKSLKHSNPDKYSGSCECTNTSEDGAYTTHNKRSISNVCSAHTPCSDESCTSRPPQANKKKFLGSKQRETFHKKASYCESPTCIRPCINVRGRRFKPHDDDSAIRTMEEVKNKSLWGPENLCQDFWSKNSPMRESFLRAYTAPCFYDFGKKMSPTDIKKSVLGGVGRKLPKRYKGEKASKTSLHSYCSDKTKDEPLCECSSSKSSQASPKESPYCTLEMCPNTLHDCENSSVLEKKQSFLNVVLQQTSSRSKKLRSQMNKNYLSACKNCYRTEAATDVKFPLSGTRAGNFVVRDEYCDKTLQVNLAKTYTRQDKSCVNKNCGRTSQSNSTQSNFGDRCGEFLPRVKNMSPSDIKNCYSGLKQKTSTYDKSCCTSPQAISRQSSHRATGGQIIPCFNFSIPTTSQVDFQRFGAEYITPPCNTPCGGKSQTNVAERGEQGPFPLYGSNTRLAKSRKISPRRKYLDCPSPAFSSSPERSGTDLAEVYGPRGKYGLFGKYGPFGVYGLRPCRGEQR